MRLSTSYVNQLGLNKMLEQQSKIAEIQEQISTGKRILEASDDPSGSSQVLRLTEQIQINNQYQRNADYATGRLSLEESVLKNIEDSLIRVKELAVQGANATLDSNDREAIATEIRERLDELLGLANTRDSNREYLFSGFQTSTRPFVQNPDGSFSYFGDQGDRAVQISSGRSVEDSHNGVEVFANIFNGNGTFQVNDTTTNTGTGVISVGQVTDTTAYVEDSYTITFVTNSAGNLAYNVVGAVSGQVIPPLPQNPVTNAPDYVSGAAINFNGIETRISENPAVGDTFTISPSVKQSVFDTVDNVLTALAVDSSTPTNDAKRNNQIARAIQDIDQAFENILRIRTDVGARLNTIDDQVNTNSDFILEMETTRSQTQDVNITEAITQLTSRLAALEAAQATFVRIQNLSLFNQL